MAWGKSSSKSDGSPPDKAAPTPVEPQDPAPQAVDLEALAPRDDVLLALIEQTEKLNDRLTKLENRFDAAMAPSDGEHDDLQGLRVNSERLATELHRVTEEMRNDVESLTQPAEANDAPAANPAQASPADEPDIDLTDPVDSPLGKDPTLRLPGAQTRSGWLPIED